MGVDKILVNLENLVDPISNEGIRTYDRQWLEHLNPEFANFLVSNTSSGSDSLPEFFSTISVGIRTDAVIKQFWEKKRKLFSLLKTLRSSRKAVGTAVRVTRTIGLTIVASLLIILTAVAYLAYLSTL